MGPQGAPTDVSERTRLAIPYLGPIPVPSRSLGSWVKFACVAGALVRLVTAWAHHHQAHLIHRLMDGDRSEDLRAALFQDDAHLARLNRAMVATMIAALALQVAWGYRRRPRARARQLGEAHVESPMRWIVPTWFHAGTIVLVVAALVLRAIGDAPTDPTLSDLAALRTFGAAASACWALAWLMSAGCVVLADRAFDRRLELSAPARLVPAAVPWFPPVEEPTVRPPDAGWILRTAGLVVLAGTAAVLTIAGVGGLAEGSTAAAGLLVLGLVGDVLAVRLFARRLPGRRPATPLA